MVCMHSGWTCQHRRVIGRQVADRWKRESYFCVHTPAESFWNKQQLRLESRPADILDSTILLKRDASVASCFISFLDSFSFYLSFIYSFIFYCDSNIFKQLIHHILVQCLTVGCLPAHLPLCLSVCMCLCCIKVNLLYITSIQGVPAARLTLSAWPPSTACWFTWEMTQIWSWRYKWKQGRVARTECWHLKHIYWVFVSKLASDDETYTLFFTTQCHDLFVGHEVIEHFSRYKYLKKVTRSISPWWRERLNADMRGGWRSRQVGNLSFNKM